MATSNLLIDSLYGITGRWVAITGAAGGIGRMLARGCAANKAHTILIDVDEENLKSAKAELEEIVSASGTEKIHVVTILADLASEEGCKKVADQIKATTDCLDGLIHCAGVRFLNAIKYTQGEDLQKLEDATLSAPYKKWELTFKVNVMAPYYLTAGVITLLGAAAKKGDGRGSVIIYSSPASVHNAQFVPLYQTSKAAVDHLVRVMAAEFATHYIRVNAIAPGLVPSAMTPNDGKSNLHLAAGTPAGRVESEEDVVGTTLWLLSKAGSFMDGKVLRAEGGLLLVRKGVTTNSD